MRYLPFGSPFPWTSMKTVAGGPGLLFIARVEGEMEDSLISKPTDVVTYYDNIVHRVSVEFVPKQTIPILTFDPNLKSNTEAQNKAVGLVQSVFAEYLQKLLPFTLDLSQKMTYDEVAQYVAAFTKLNPHHIRFYHPSV